MILFHNFILFFFNFNFIFYHNKNIDNFFLHILYLFLYLSCFYNSCLDLNLDFFFIICFCDYYVYDITIHLIS
jgi:hypothetical protein